MQVTYVHVLGRVNQSGILKLSLSSSSSNRFTTATEHLLTNPFLRFIPLQFIAMSQLLNSYIYSFPICKVFDKIVRYIVCTFQPKEFPTLLSFSVRCPLFFGLLTFLTIYFIFCPLIYLVHLQSVRFILCLLLPLHNSLFDLKRHSSFYDSPLNVIANNIHSS